MNLLSIGNSFSQDAQKWLHPLAKNNGITLEAVNLYIGGCSLETHWKNAQENNAFYDLEINGEKQGKISIADALQLKEWDVITLQQFSGASGFAETYEPYLSSLLAMVKAAQPQAKLCFHQTWAYEIDSPNGSFPLYHNDQQEMYQRIIQTSETIAKQFELEIIPVGKIIQTLREQVPEFEYQNGGCSLCRDGSHLSLDYGRYAAAATWLRVLTGIALQPQAFEDFDPDLLKKINCIINKEI